jgi:hypothetical protein
MIFIPCILPKTSNNSHNIEKQTYINMALNCLLKAFLLIKQQIKGNNILVVDKYPNMNTLDSLFI